LNVGIAVTGGAVSTKLLNSTIISAAREIIAKKGTPYILSGGWGAILEHGLKGVQEITYETIQKWENQSYADYITDRRLPQRSKNELEEIISSLKEKNITRLIIIGGNGSSSALKGLYQFAPDYFTHLVQILKTMDGDCVSPFYNLGFASTLAHAGTILNAYDNETSLYGSPYVVKLLGREVGQLCLHLGIEKKPCLALMREEFGSRKISFKELTSLLLASTLKQLSVTGTFGSLLLAEGIMDCLDEKAQKQVGVRFVKDLEVKRIDFTKAHLEASLKDSLSKALTSFGVRPFGVPLQVGARSIGYYARAEDPVERDLSLAKEYGKRAGVLVSSKEKLRCPTLLLPDKEVELESILNHKNEVEQCWVDTKGEKYLEFVSSQYRLTLSDLEGDSFEKIHSYTKVSRKKLKKVLQEPAELFSKMPL
jgi:6-phosphofructokinase